MRCMSGGQISAAVFFNPGEILGDGKPPETVEEMLTGFRYPADGRASAVKVYPEKASFS